MATSNGDGQWRARLNQQPDQIPLRLLLAAQSKRVTPMLQVVHRVTTRHLLGQAGLKADEADSGAVTLIQRFGNAEQVPRGAVSPVLGALRHCKSSP